MIANKRIMLPLLLLGFCILIYPKNLELRTKAGNYEVRITIDKNPPILGNNKIEIEIKDDKGALVTDVDVLVNYYMPPMPRMAPMNYRTKAKLKGETFRAKMKFIMEGPWILAIKITREEKTVTARFNVDAR